jgi:ribosomal protein L3 glutamine methyltransferase
MLKSDKNTTLINLIHQVNQALEQADVYFGHGTDNAWDEAVALVLHALDLSFNEAHENQARVLTSDEIKKVEALLTRRIHEKKPLAYLTQEAYFFGLPFYVDERVIIPRSPIAELIEKHFMPWVNPDKVTSILDMCTGSACIAIACAYAFEYARVDAIDIDPDALEVAKINIAKHKVEQQVNIIQSDLFEQVPPHQYDIIISNPPYVSQDEMDVIPAEYLTEPHHALHAHDEGLALVERILTKAPSYLSDEGILIVEVGNGRERLEARYPHLPFLWLEFEHGGQGVFLLEKSQLTQNVDR